MQYQVTDSRYILDKEINAIFSTNDREEAVMVADESGSGYVVVRCDESGLKEMVYSSAYKLDLGIIE